MKLLIQEFPGQGGSLELCHCPYLPREGEEVTLGRDPSNRVVLADRSVSRHHARLSFDGVDWRIQDLGSRYGTELNGVTLERIAAVKAGDKLRLGTQLIALLAAPERSAAPPTEDLGLLSPGPADLEAADPGEPAGIPDLERRYWLLVETLEILAEDRSMPDLLSEVIRLAGTAVAADRGFILLHDAESGRWLPDSVSAWQAPLSSGPHTPLTQSEPPSAKDASAAVFSGDTLAQVSQTVLRDALASGKTVFLKYAAKDPRYEKAESIHMQSVQSLICCPLLVGEKRVGAFYVDRKHEGSSPFTDEDGELLEAIAHQAARLLEKEQLLDERNRSEKLALLGTMVGRITHELKNPLYNIRGTTENLLEKIDRGIPAAEDLRQRLERILGGVEKAENRMRNLLRFARPSAGKRGKVQLSRILTAAAVETADRLSDNGVSLQRSYGKGIFVLADPEALEQVFSNLLVNSAQALGERGGGTVSIETSVEKRLSDKEPDWVEVRVFDDGPGIAQENLERIFDDFFTTKLGSGGSGLGLALCRHLVDEHRGSLTAENRPGGGALFRVGLPLYQWDESKSS